MWRSYDRAVQQLVFLKPGAFEVQEVPDPKIKAPGQALVKPLAVAACDLDSHIIHGRAPFRGPFALGHECIGEVVAVGEAVNSVKIGDRVSIPFQISCGRCAPCLRGHTGNCSTAGPHATFGFGKPCNTWGGLLADLALVPFADAMLVPVPAAIPPETLASLSDNLPDGWRAIAPFVSDPTNSSVLVVGGMAKSVGLYATAIALALGVREVDYIDNDPICLQKAQMIGANAIRRNTAPAIPRIHPYSRRELYRAGTGVRVKEYATRRDILQRGHLFQAACHPHARNVFQRDHL